MDTLHWFDVFGGLFYDALAIGLLHLEELNIGGSLLWLMHLEALEVFDLAYALEALEVILGGGGCFATLMFWRSSWRYISALALEDHFGIRFG